MPTTKRYGWLVDRPDQRDHYFAASTHELLKLPVSIDLRAQCPPVYDQLALGSCTANAIAGALEFDQGKQNEPEVTPSRLFIYYNERKMEHTIASDAGAAIRDGIKSVNVLGACDETLWPYDISQYMALPPRVCYLEAMKHRSVSYQRIPQSLSQMKACLASGYPFIFGFTVYESFESDAVAQTGIVPMPGPAESTIGGHAVLAVGYDDAPGWFYCRNSWGSNWGMAGYFMMPFSYLLSHQLASDFWVIRTVQ
jgi:C1A family cysteine protease